METKGGFYITQIKQLQDRIFERLLMENGIEISGGQGRILFILWKNDHLTISEISRATSLAKNTVSIVVDGMVNKNILERHTNPEKPPSDHRLPDGLRPLLTGKVRGRLAKDEQPVLSGLFRKRAERI